MTLDCLNLLFDLLFKRKIQFLQAVLRRNQSFLHSAVCALQLNKLSRRLNSFAFVRKNSCGCHLARQFFNGSNDRDRSQKADHNRRQERDEPNEYVAYKKLDQNGLSINGSRKHTYRPIRDSQRSDITVVLRIRESKAAMGSFFNREIVKRNRLSGRKDDFSVPAENTDLISICRKTL